MRLPPGRAKLSMSPRPRIAHRDADDGNLRGRLLGGSCPVVMINENNVYPVLHQLPCGGGQCRQIALGEAQ